MFGRNKIFNYDPTAGDCSNLSGSGGTVGGSCGGDVVGDTVEERLRDIVTKYGVLAMNMQIEYGIPWEIPFIHVRAESGVGNVAGVAGGVERCGYYNWMGYTYASVSLYGLSESEMPCKIYHDTGYLASMYESIGDMIGALTVDFLRNGAYDAAFDYATQDNFDLWMFLTTELRSYCGSCATNTSGVYHTTYESSLSIIHEVASQNGWPTSEELMRQMNIAKGGKYPVDGDVKDVIQAEPHSLHADCSGSGVISGSGTNSLYTGDGSDVTIIGDSITVYNQMNGSYDEKLPNADIYAKSSKGWWYDAGADNPSGLKVLGEIVSQGKLRDNLVFALGSNNGNGVEVTDEYMNDMLELASGASKIVILTNYKGGTNEYSMNNELFARYAENNSKIVLADWKGAVGDDYKKYMQFDGIGFGYIHPTKEGSDLFVQLIVEALGTGGTNGQVSDGVSNCGCEDNPVNVSGGLTDGQISKIIEYYLSDTVNTAAYGLPNKDNCVTFSAFFVREFANDKTEYYGNGKVVTTSLKEAGYETGDEPQIFSVFSKSNTTRPQYGHTGIVVAIDGDTITTIEADLGSGKYAYKATYKKDAIINDYGPKYAYFANRLDIGALSRVLGENFSMSYNETSGGVASSEVTWADGWITGGMDGYVKESAVESSYTLGDSAHTRQYVTTDGNGVVGPNKITLHSTEGGNLDGTSGLKLYGNDGSGIYPAHFTIDLKNKRVYQHFPITQPADSVIAHDDSAGVQIEIIGFSSSSKEDDPFYLFNEDNFGADEWTYLGKLLAAISSEAKIPLTSSVDWTKESRLSIDDFESYTGVLGHMHVPDNDHTDPGNIWSIISRYLQTQNQNTGCNNTSNNKSWTGDFPYYDQCDSQWGNETYGHNNICGGGCGPSSFAMMATALTGTIYTPDVVAKSSVEHGQRASSGTSWSMASVLADEFGLVAEDISVNAETISNKLREGYMVWTCGTGSSPFTGTGHCIGIRGITSDGRWLLADSNGKGGGEANTLEKDWDPNSVASQMSCATALRKK